MWKHKKHQFIFFLLRSCFVMLIFGRITLMANAYEGSVVLETQEDVDTFGNSYQSITGNIIISGISITSLESLNQITFIGGDLRIVENDALYKLNSFNELTEIRGSILIQSNNKLKKIEGFEKLKKIGGFLGIEYCSNIMTISGFAQLLEIGSELSLAYNPRLNNIGGFFNLQRIGESLNISDNDSLTNIDALSNITSSGAGFGVRIYNNDALQNIDGLISIREIKGGLKIAENDEIQQVKGLLNVTSVGESVYMKNNKSLKSLDGLEQLKKIGLNFEIVGNGNLSHCCAVEEFAAVVKGRLVIKNNAEGCKNYIDINTNCSKDADQLATVQVKQEQALVNESSNENIIDLLSFDGEIWNQGNLLQWYTEKENDNDFFSIYHSTDGNQYKLINTIASKGNSRSITPYNMVHRMASKGNNYYYITQTTKASDIGVVSNILNLSRVEEDMILLNLAIKQSQLELTYVVPKTGSVIAKIYDENGSLVKSQAFNAIVNDYNLAEIDINMLIKGNYLVEIEQELHKVRTRFIVY